MTQINTCSQDQNILNIIRMTHLIILSMFLVLGTGINCVILDPFEYQVKYLSRYSKGSRMTQLIPVPKTKNILNIIRRVLLIILSMFLVLGTGINCVILDLFEYRLKYLTRYSKGSRMTNIIPVLKTKNILNIIRWTILIILSMFLVLGTGINVCHSGPLRISS